ncbi:tol-pal system protein YbgF [Xanthobacter sp. TB0136]|uniref:tol-pal system protein YbgF n=1 Tax=Xanthobacter sp. TB0136 TaxID=3459177 RepID=UPI004039257F
MKMIRLPHSGALVVALLCSLSLPAAAQQSGNLFGNIFKPPGAAAEAERTAAENVEIMERLDGLEQTLRQLTGQVETLQHRNQQLEAQVKMLTEGGSARTGGASSAASAIPPAGATAPAPASSGRRSDAFDPKTSPELPGTPHPLGSPDSASKPVIGDAGLENPAAGTSSARALYDAGVVALQKGQHEAAEQSFRAVISGHGSDRLVPDATYMVGETLFLRQDFSEAAASFLEVTTKFPNSVRAPEALLRLGQSLAGLGEKEAACATFMEVGRKYPRAASSIRQAVEKEQQRVGC